MKYELWRTHAGTDSISLYSLFFPNATYAELVQERDHYNRAKKKYNNHYWIKSVPR